MDKYHILDRGSRHYFQPFKSTAYWVAEKYPSAGLQTVNTQTFQNVFRHPHGTPRWGFVKNYIKEMKDKLKQTRNEQTFAIDAIAIWINTTINSLRLNDDDYYVQERCNILIDYAKGEVSLNFLKRRYPFIAKEVVRQNLGADLALLFKL